MSNTLEFTFTDEQNQLRERAREVAVKGVQKHGRFNDSWINGFSKEFAQTMGFELDQTAQHAADELEDKLVDNGDAGEPKVEPVHGRMPHEAPPEEVVDAAPSSVEDPIEEPNETNS